MLNKKIGFVLAVCLVVPAFLIFAQEKEGTSTFSEALVNQIQESPSSDTPTPTESSTPTQTTSQEFLGLAWEASGQGNLDKINSIIDEVLKLYGEEAKKQGADLKAFPMRSRIGDYQTFNDVATCLFVKAEALMNFGKSEEAIALFKKIIEEYKWAQSWDPARGAYWSVAEKSQASIDVLTGKVEDEPEEVKKTIVTLPKIHFKGKDDVIDYTKYGEFIGVGTKDYEYRIDNPAGLSEAAGEGIYPNTSGVLKDPNYKKVKDEGRLEGSHWDYVRTDDLEAAFYKWAVATEPPGVKLLYLGMILEKANMPLEAIKAYHAIVVHFPKTVAWTYWQTPWYPGQVAISKIRHIIRSHPELNLTEKWMKVKITNGFDNVVGNDIILTWPGRIEKKGWLDQLKARFNLEKKTVSLGNIKKKIGEGKVRLVQYDNGHWQLLVDNKPYVIHGVTYTATKIGQSPDKGTLKSWMTEDENRNGKPDGPYDAWVDKNRNNAQDPDEPTVGDFQLLKEMGANTIREYYHPHKPQKELLRKLYDQHGIRVIMGNFLGKYTLGSGAKWLEGTDYENPVHQKNMIESVKEMVMDLKDEPYILIWLLGNENNYGVASNANKKPEAYYKFANEVARVIKSIDPDHPVAICNGDTLFLDIFAKNAPDVDIFSANVYRGDYGFGSFWEQVAEAAGKPAFITEYGAPAYAAHLTLEEAEVAQANYHRGNWLDIEANTAGLKDSAGNAIGGVVFEWLDEWWKNYEPFRHDRKSDAIGPFPGGYYFEEWFGITGQGKGQNSPYLRQLRKAYFTYQEMWTKPKK